MLGIDALRDAVFRQPEMHHRRRRDAHFRRHPRDRLQEAEMLEHRMVRREVDLAGDLVALRPGRDAVELDAMRQRDLLDAVEAPEEIEVPPGAAILAVGRELEADLLLLAHDLLDLAVLDRLELARAELALLMPGAGGLDRLRAQDRADMVGAERWLGSLHQTLLRFGLYHSVARNGAGGKCDVVAPAAAHCGTSHWQRALDLENCVP